METNQQLKQTILPKVTSFDERCLYIYIYIYYNVVTLYNAKLRTGSIVSIIELVVTF